MATAAWCSECNAWVWVSQDGGCVNGHPRSALRQLYEASDNAGVAAAPSVPTAVRPVASVAAVPAAVPSQIPSPPALAPVPDADPVEAYKRQGVVAGASLWLFIIAGLTAANLVMQLTGSSYRWVIGLYSTRYVLRLFAMIGLSPGALAKGLLLAISLVGAIVFVYLGVLVRRKNFLALRVAALLYSTDLVVGFLVTGLRDWVGFAFHFFFLVGLIAATRAERPGGLSARRLSWDMEVFRRR